MTRQVNKNMFTVNIQLKLSKIGLRQLKCQHIVNWGQKYDWANSTKSTNNYIFLVCVPPSHFFLLRNKTSTTRWRRMSGSVVMLKRPFFLSNRNSPIWHQIGSLFFSAYCFSFIQIIYEYKAFLNPKIR